MSAFFSEVRIWGTLAVVTVVATVVDCTVLAIIQMNSAVILSIITTKGILLSMFVAQMKKSADRDEQSARSEDSQAEMRRDLEHRDQKLDVLTAQIRHLQEHTGITKQSSADPDHGSGENEQPA